MDKVGIGFVGTGGMAGSHLKSLQEIEGVEIVGLCDVAPEKAAAAVEEWGGKAYTDYRRMLDEEEMDALYVCVPPFAHTDAEMLAARRGIHLFVEKPVAMDLRKGMAILEEIDRAGVVSSVGYQLRHTPWVQGAKRFVEGRDIAMVTANRWGGIPGDENHWWRVFEKSGGQLVEMATHQVDMMRLLAGDVRSVYARYARRVTGDVPNMTVPDVQVVALEFASGAVGYISTSCALTKGGYGSDLKVVLRDMVLEVGSRLKVVPEGAAEIEPFSEQDAGIDAAFVQALKTGDRSSIRCDYREGLKSAAVCIAANESAASGRPVECWNG